MNFLKNIHLSDRQFFWLFFILLGALSYLLVVAYAMPIHPGHDYYFHELRIHALMDALKEGTYPYYIDYKAVNGYGYLTRAFYSDIILVPFAIIGNATSFEFAYQIMIFVMTMLCGVFTYWAVKSIFKNNIAAAVSSILYTFCYYRIIDLFYRSALGESFSFTFLPLIYLGLYHIIKGDYKKWYILAIGYILMIFTHVISSALTFITIIIFLGIYNKSIRQEPKRILYLVLAAIFTLLITACYVFPMLEQMASNTFYYNKYHVLLAHRTLGFKKSIWSLFSGVIQPHQEFMPAIGITLTAAIALRLFIIKKTIYTKHADILTLLGIMLLIMSSFVFPWHIYPFYKITFFQFPWRLFEFASLFFAVAGGYYFATAFLNEKRQLTAYALLIVLILFIFKSDGHYQKYVSDKAILSYGRNFDGKPAISNLFFLGGLEYLPSSVPSLEYLNKRGDTITVKKNSDIKNFARNKNIVSFDTEIKAPNDIIELPLIYYKGYKAIINGKEIPIQQSTNGLVEIEVKQTGHIDVFFNSTILHRISNYISLTSFILLLIFIFASMCRKDKNKALY